MESLGKPIINKKNCSFPSVTTLLLSSYLSFNHMLIQQEFCHVILF